MAKKRKTMKRAYHIFERKREDGKTFRLKAAMKSGTAIVTLELTEADVRRAIALDGFADAQNCAGAVCVTRNSHLFNHAIDPSGLVDWWTRRVHVLEKQMVDGTFVCRVYAHADNVAGLFDAPDGLKDLLKLVKEAGGKLTLKLYPARRGRHSRTGKPSNPSGPSKDKGPGKKHAPRLIGNELRLFNFNRARMGKSKTDLLASRAIFEMRGE